MRLPAVRGWDAGTWNKHAPEYNRNVRYDRKNKDTRTGRYLRETSPRHGYDGKILLPPQPSPPGRVFVPRLTLRASPKAEYDVEGFARSVAAAPKDALFFCDTSLFDRRTYGRLWEALLNREGKVVVVPPVRRELEPWLASNPEHAAARAVLDGAPAVRFLGLDPDDWREHATLEYYVDLLGFRKRLLALERARFEEEHGRAPDEGEIRALKQGLNNNLGPRGYMLAKKGAEAEGSPNLCTDETLVYLAMKTAIQTGREVIILSKDEDVLEQFYKLQWLLDTHYRGMLLADLFARDPGRFVARPMPEDDPDLSEMFAAGDDGLLVERPGWLITGDAAPVLPPYCHPAVVHCMIVGERLSTMVFCAEREMERLLHTKAVTGGLNTYKLGGRNCHLWLAPLDVPRSLRGCAVVARDRRVKAGLISMPLFDGNQAVFSGERFMHAVAT